MVLPRKSSKLAATAALLIWAAPAGAQITAGDMFDAQIKAWDDLSVELEKDVFMKKVLDSQRAWVERVTYFELMASPDYQLAYNHYFPNKLKL